MESASYDNDNNNSDRYNIILFFENSTYYYDNTSSLTSEILINLLDSSQQVMTIIGLIANIGTSITLIKNGRWACCNQEEEHSFLAGLQIVL